METIQAGIDGTTTASSFQRSSQPL